MMDVKEQIREYQFGSNDWDLVGATFASSTMRGIFVALSEMIASGFQVENRDNDFYKAVWFIADVGMLSPREIRTPFRAYFVRSRLLRQMRSLLYSDSRSIRKSVLYTLDKVGIPSNGDFFEPVFHRFYATDPLWTPDLLSALSWARRNVDLSDVYLHPNYLVRWPVLIQWIDYPALPPLLGLYDENSRIRAEAEHCHREEAYRERVPTRTKQENKLRRKEIENLRPKIEWWLISLKFENFLSAAMRDNYKMEELDAFVQALAKENE